MAFKEDIPVCDKQPWQDGWRGQEREGSLVCLDFQESLPPKPALQPEFLNTVFSALQTKIQGNENLLGTRGNAAFLQLPSGTCSQDVPLAPSLSSSTAGLRKHQCPMTSQDLPPTPRKVLCVWTCRTLGFRFISLVICTHSFWSEVETGFWS